jgi:signal transduction histidine kinase
MTLTFALFVGSTVVIVLLYSMLVLREEIHEAARESLLQQTERTARQLIAADSSADRYDVVRAVSRVTDYRITVASADSVLWDVQEEEGITSEQDFFSRPEVAAALTEGRGFSERRVANGREMLFTAFSAPESNLVVRLGHPQPPLFGLVRRMQWTLIGGMVLALLSALVGSAIASYQVTKPLKAIRRSARRINQGYLDERISVDSRAAEFQDLADSLNGMAERFREDIAELRRITQIQHEFIGNVSHEVKNPIFAVSGYLEALSSSRLTEEQRRRYAEKGLFNLQRLNNLFSDLIEIARLGYREDLIEPEVFNLQELLEEVAETLGPKAEENDLDLLVDNEPVHVEADRSRIAQVLTNLMDNAIAYTDEGTVRCRYRRRQEKVRVEVIDTGRGIGEEHLERVFERFYRVDTSRSRQEGGTGLGLSIVKQILQAHGESIHVESTVGRGTRFWFDLPWAEQPVDEKEAATDAASAV